MSVNIFHIRGDTLKHLLDWCRLDEAAVARKLHLKPAKIASWISGESGPTWNQLEDFARYLNVPVTTFFRPWQDPEMPLKDFRRGPNAGSTPSMDLLSLVYDARRKQDWWKEQALATDCPLVCSVKPAMHPADAGRRVREILGLDELQRRSRSWDEFRRNLCAQMERLGVLVLRRGHVRDATSRKIRPDEAAGFAIPDQTAPVVYVNTGTYVNAQIFTLVHEAVHLAMSQQALDDDLEIADLPRQETERFCDRAAAEALVPADELERAWQGDADVMARKFRVSTWVILLRALELNMIRREEYFRMLADYRRQIQKEPTSKRRGRIDANIAAWNGRRFTNAVVERLREGKITHTEAASLLWVSTRSLLAYLRSVE
jgi:Zn-dependent peptidase ImmA (M78 family)/transcriptional regulator with XRE-family HTH domain